MKCQSLFSWGRWGEGGRGGKMKNIILSSAVKRAYRVIKLYHTSPEYSD